MKWGQLWTCQIFSSHSRVGQRGAEVFPYVGLQHRVKVLKFPVGDEANYEDLSGSRDTLIRRENARRKSERGEEDSVSLNALWVEKGAGGGMGSGRRMGGEHGKKKVAN